MIYAIIGGFIAGAASDSGGYGCVAFLFLLALDEIHSELVAIRKRLTDP